MSITVEFIDNKSGFTVKLIKPYKNKYFGIRIPSNFQSDLGSVPPWARSIVPTIGSRLTEAYLVHDWLYRDKAKGVNRKTADKILYKMMKIAGVPMWRRYSIYYMVRMFGKKAWKKHREVK